VTGPAKVPLVIDASAVVALLVDAGPAGRWVTASVSGTTLAAPQLVLFEVANVLRRHALAGLLDETQATLAHADLCSLPLQLWPYAPLAERAWQLRHNVTIYDAAYLALAEMLGASMITLDARIAGARGAECPILAYGSADS
jgi:predicted nucleic acid-binding protein